MSLKFGAKRDTWATLLDIIQDLVHVHRKTSGLGAFPARFTQVLQSFPAGAPAQPRRGVVASWPRLLCSWSGLS